MGAIRCDCSKQTDVTPSANERRPERDIEMDDVIYVAVVLVFFALMAGLVRLCANVQ